MSAIFIFLLKNLMVLIALILWPKRSILLGIRNANRLCKKVLTVKKGDWAQGAWLSISDGKACTTRVNRQCLRDPCVIQFIKLTYFVLELVNLKILEKSRFYLLFFTLCVRLLMSFFRAIPNWSFVIISNRSIEKTIQSSVYTLKKILKYNLIF